MRISSENGVKFLTFDTMAGYDLVHAILTRHGGTSPDPWRSLNIGGTVGDDPLRVKENLTISLRSQGLDVSSVFDVWQVHGVDVAHTNAPREPGSEHLKADIITTKTRGVVLLMRFADCVPIILFDPKERAIAIVHAGWRGTISGAARRAVDALQQAYGSKPGNIMAGVGPAICANHYEVGVEVVSKAQTAFGKRADDVCYRIGERFHFDLWNANRMLLQDSGVEQIEMSNVCTACHSEDWFSHRLTKGRTGRFGALVALC